MSAVINHGWSEDLGWVEPVQAFRASAGIPGRVFFDSAGPVGHLARWSVLAVRPLEVIEARVGDGLAGGMNPCDPFERLADLHERWEGIAAGCAKPGVSLASRIPGACNEANGSGGTGARVQGGLAPLQGIMPPFQDACAPFRGGVVALLGYDCVRVLERLPAVALDDPLLPDMWAAVYDGALVFDRLQQRLVAYSRGIEGQDRHRELVGIRNAAALLVSEATFLESAAALPEKSAGSSWIVGRTIAEDLHPDELRRWHRAEDDPAGALSRSPRAEDDPAGALSRWPRAEDDPAGAMRRSPRAKDHEPGEPSLICGENGALEALGDRDRFLDGVARIREEIARGEIYQANLTRRIVRDVRDADASKLYERLRVLSPTPFAAFVDAGGFQVLSASPERFVRLDRGVVETRPIKGTRRRGRDDSEDAALRAELLSSAKDAAELLMIVDLERNDLGRVSETGTIQVVDFPSIEAYSTVSHLVATVRGRLRHEAGPEMLLRSAFPGGSITGAPKVRAMEIIEALEPHRRKFAMGALVAWDFGGSLDSSILIRTIVVRGGKAIFNVGSGIVADSSPEEEFQETEAKAAPLIVALEAA